MTPRMESWDVTWNSISLGTVDEVQPDLKLVTKPIKRGTTGEHVLGEWITELSGTVKVQLKDITRTIMEKMVPWFAGTPGTDSIPLTPTGLAVDLYTYAQELVLHPHNTAGTKEDIHLTKSVPITAVNMKRKGTEDDMWEVEFKFYPDRTAITAGSPAVKYGYVGDVAI